MPGRLNGDGGENGGVGVKKNHGRSLDKDQHHIIKISQKTALGLASGAGDGGFPDGVSKDDTDVDSYSCHVCKRFGLPNWDAVQQHCASKRHILALELHRENLSKKDERFVPRLRIESDAVFDQKKGEHTLSVKIGNGIDVQGQITFTLTNVSANSVFDFDCWYGLPATEEFAFLKPDSSAKLRLNPNEQLKLTLLLMPRKEAVHALSIFVRLNDIKRQTVRLDNCHTKISFVSELEAELSKTAGHYVYKRGSKHKLAGVFFNRGQAEPGMPLPGLGERDSLEKTRPLQHYDMKRHVHQFINDGLQVKEGYHNSDEARRLQVYQTVLGEKLSFHNYQQRFEILLYMEEHQTRTDMDSYFMERVRLQRHGRGNLLSIEVPGLAENRPSVLRGDHMYVRDYVGPDKYGKREYQGIVHDVQQTRVFLGFSSGFVQRFVEGMEFCVRFSVNRLPMKLQHRALSLKDPEESDLENVLFPTADTARTHGHLVQQNTLFRYYARSPAPNPEQERAIRHIVMGTSRPAPYIVFGPPGTGKTFTIVEAIKQVVLHMPNARVLACAPSNSAADLMAEKLKDHLQGRQVYRMNAFSRTVSTIPDKIKEISNVTKDGEVYFPNKDALDKKGIRVFVTTFITAGRLVSAEFARNHITHVFMDEASHATEPESLVAVAGLLYANDRPAAGKQLVLAGDPQQLGPILRSPYAKKLKLDMSMMERLMSNPLYQRRPAPGKDDDLYYDPLLITKLVRNYRSHDAILTVPNRLFYNNDLQACGLPELTHMMVRWEHLPNPKMPVVFHAIIGEDQQEKNSPSFFNAHEVGLVIKYVTRLVGQKTPVGTTIKEDHIGIISPYRKQVQKIQGELRKRKLTQIKVGSVEEFQGQERQVIIVSTVRSNPRYLTTDNKFGIGFLQNDKRFNVAVTRPKALLVVIGNPNILRHNASWNDFVQYCRDNQCMVDSHLDRDQDEGYSSLAEQLKLLNLEEEESDVWTAAGDMAPSDLHIVSALNNEEAISRDRYI